MPEDLTDKRELVLLTIADYIENCGHSPSYKETAVHLGLSSPNGIQQHVERLEKDGYILRQKGVSRGLHLTKKASKYIGAKEKESAPGKESQATISLKDQNVLGAYLALSKTNKLIITNLIEDLAS